MTSSPARHINRHRGAPARRDLLCRTALCGALMGVVVSIASPSYALPVWTGQSQVNPGGALPSISSTAGTTNVGLNAPRTVIDWSTYNVASGETVNYNFNARNWIVLNRIQDNKTPEIDGTIAGHVNGAFGGNIWFASHSGMIIGEGAQIDAGGLLLSTAAPDLATFLDPNNLTFVFPGAEVVDQPAIGMLPGSSINGHGGLVAIIAPTIITGAGTAVTGQNGSNVLYGAATGFKLTLAQNAPGDFDLVDFIIPNGSDAQVLMDLQNSTSANSVFVAAVSRSQASSSVINLQGMITAQAVTADGGDIILSGRSGIVGKQPGPDAGGTPTDIYLRTSSASRDIVLETGGQVFGDPYVRPPPPPPPDGPPPAFVPPPPPGDGCNNLDAIGCDGGGGNGFGGGGDDCISGCELALGGPLISARLHSVVNDLEVSNLTAGRDTILMASEAINLGSAKAGRDLIIDSDTLQANSLSAGRALTLKSEGGDLLAGSVTAAGAGTISSAGSVQFDSLSLTGGAGQTLNVQSAGDIGLGDGSGSASGGSIVLNAAGNVTVDLASASLTTVTAGGTANLQAGTLNVGTVSANEVLLQGGGITVAHAVSANDIYVSSSGGASVGTAKAGDDIYVLASGGDASLTNATLTGAAADQVGPGFGGNPDKAGNGRVLAVQSVSGSATLGSATGSVTGATAVSVVGGLDATVQLPTALPGALTVTAGRDASLTAPSVTFNAVTAGRDVTLMTTGGDFTSSAALVATRNLSIGAVGALTVGDITASSGSITLTGRSVTAGAVMAGQDLTLKASNGAVNVAKFQAGRDLIVQGSSLSLGQQLAAIGRDLSITTPGAFTAGSALTAGRNVTLNVGGMATLQGVNAPGNVDIIANDLTLGGAINAQNVQIESATGALQVGGGSAPASGLWLDNTEFGQIHAKGQVNLYAGLAAGATRGDLTILNLDVNPASTPQVNFLVGTGHNALVQGLIAPTASGGVVHIGDNANGSWKPDSILVSGQIGAAAYSNGSYSNVRDFDDVRLFATNDIIIGSQRFISLIQSTSNADIEIGKNKPAGVAATAAEQNRVLVAAGDLELSASGKVVSQNTGPTPDQSVGLFLTGKPGATAVTPDLIIDPPQLVDLYGSFVSQGGQVVSSFSAGAGVAFTIVDSAGNPTSAPLGAIYRFDSCTLGTNQCAGATTVTSNLAQNTPTLNVSSTGGGGLGADTAGGGSGDSGDSGDGSSGGGSSGGGKGSAAKAAGGRNSGPPLLSSAPPEADAVLTDPVTTGAGSEEIWRKRDKDAKPSPQGSKP
ncbi:filamentous hemagglutinin N-terminal domain-containing protein [Phenylobacterium sp.]|uniref:beta strand repeat-containing protein n=1 Tax=Phenylobacterium sp. TaxID=1871053 RepID=UPI002C24F133|nr:filamentous hemagglutinin N-terminal domain-containing protein [Phenylobacterium sp.]HLZ73661.1 filamentous hemagglutinin N-terminal domain-containing protein [Phenylobacterium sp.]